MFDQLPSAQTRSPRSLVLSLAIHASLCIAILAAGFTVQSIVAPTRTTSVQLVAPIPIPPMKRRTIRLPKPTVATFAKLPPIKLTAPPPAPASTVLIAPQPILAIAAKQPSEPPVLKEVFAAAPPPKPNPIAPPKVQLGGFSTASTSLDQAIPKLQVSAADF